MLQEFIQGWSARVGVVAMLASLQGCEPCAGKTGEELETCEAEQDSKADDGATSDTSGNASDGTSSSGSGGGTSDDTSVVAAEGFEASFDDGEWQVDSTTGARTGTRAVHPPALQARDEASMTFECDGSVHSQFSFWWNQVVGQNASCCNALPTETLGLDLYIDDEFRETFGRLGGWQRAILNVPKGKHTYKFIARSEIDTAPWGQETPVPPFVLDDFECRLVEAEPAHNEHVTFDARFIPTEIDGDWLVDNTQGIQDGEAAIHPPALDGGDTSSMTFDCNNTVHTQFGFWWNQISGQNASCCNALPTTELAFDLKIDGKPREIFGRGGGWQYVVLNVDRGEHSYEFTARAENATTLWGSSDPTPPFVLDTFDCINEEPTDAVNGRIDFDGEFVPPEVSGDWFVDNTRGTHEGAAATHPPALEAEGESVMTVDCSDIDHESFSFSWNQIVGQNASCCNALPLEDLAFDLFIDDGDKRTFGNAGGWRTESISVEPGGHVYKFVARSRNATVAWGGTDPTPPFVIDSIVCE